MDTVDWTFRRYSPADVALWDKFVSESRNATFMHLRGYMDYHSDRFSDHSLLAYKDGSLRAVLPANLTMDDDGNLTLHSHQGLTYGGWLLPRHHFDGVDMLGLMDALAEYCRGMEITELDYKPIPYIYASQPSQEDLYALFRLGAELSESGLSEAITLDADPGFNTLRRRHLKKARTMHPDFTVREITDDAGVAAFHAMLTQCLRQRHGATPVHSFIELQLLRRRFPENIRIFGGYALGTRDDIQGNENSMVMEAGVCIYTTPLVAHCQYIATTPYGRENNLLTPLFDQLIHREFSGVRYFDFGTSNEQGGQYLNAGLLRQKASYGGSGVAYQRYRLRID